MSTAPPRDPNRNFLALGSGEAVARVIAFAATIYIARMLGAEGYGVVAFAAGVNLYLAKVADFAIEYVGIAEVAEATESLDRLASIVLSTRMAIAAVLTATAILIVQLTVPDPERTVLSLYFVALLPLAANTKWVHTGLHDTRAVGAARVIGEALGLLLVLGLVHAGTELWVPPVAQVVAEACAAVLLWIVLRRRGHRLVPAWDLSVALPVFRRAAPVMAIALLGLLLYNSDLIFLRFLRGRGDVGQYAAAYTLIGFLANLGLAYAMSLLPALAHFGQDSDDERSLYHRSLAESYAVSLPVCVGGWLLASPIIRLGFGAEYSDSAAALAVLMWSIPLTTLRNVPLAALIARRRQGLLVKATFYAVLGNIVLNVALIVPFGIVGAAMATVATECLAGVLMLVYSAREGLSFVGLGRLWRPTLAALIMGVAVAALGSAGLLLGLGVGVSVYAAALAGLGGVRFRKGRLPALNV